MTSIDNTLVFKVTERGWPAVLPTYGLWYNRNTLVECSDGISRIVVTYSVPNRTSEVFRYQHQDSIVAYLTEVYGTRLSLGYIEADLLEDCDIKFAGNYCIPRDSDNQFPPNVDTLADEQHDRIVQAIQLPNNWPPKSIKEIVDQTELPF